MATFEKIIKAVEFLKSVSSTSVLPDKTDGSGTKLPNNLYPTLKKKDADSIRKEKIHHIYNLVESFSQKQIRNFRNNEEFIKILSASFEILFQLCDDTDSDLRMVANEALNKIIKSLMDTALGKIQIELYKEIKKNGNSRSLRAVMWRFGELAHLIMPSRRRPYVINLIPIFIKLSKRKEESVLETLSTMVCKVWYLLGEFATEKELELLLNEFAPNIKHSSPVIRRATVQTITALCQYSRKPDSAFLTFLWNIIDQTVDSSSGVLGILLLIRNFHPFLFDIAASDESDLKLEHMILRICLNSLGSANHNIVTSSLETLCPFFKDPPMLMSKIFLDENYYMSLKSKISPELEYRCVDKTTDCLKFENKAEEFNEDTTSISKVEFATEALPENKQTFIDPLSAVAMLMDGDEKEVGLKYLKTPSPMNMAVDLKFVNPSESPIVYIVRKIASSYLLPNIKGQILEDSTVRVSVKSLSLNCLGATCFLNPGILNTSIKYNEDSQSITEVLLYSNHPDPQIRCGVYAIVETLIILKQWEAPNVLNISFLVDILMKGLKDDAPLSCKQAVIGVRTCIPFLLNTNCANYALILCKQLLTLENSSYWLLKVELAETLGTLPLDKLVYANSSENIQDKIYNSIKLLLSDEDHRVRNSVAKCISQIIPRIIPAQFPNCNDAILMIAQRDFHKSLSFTLNERIATQTISQNLHRIITFLFQNERSSNKFLSIGCIESLSLLAKEFPVLNYKDAWGCSSPSSQGLAYIEQLFSLLTFHPFSCDLTMHANILNLISYIITGIAQGCLKERVPKEAYSHIKSKIVSDQLQSTIHHVMKVMHLCSCVIEGSNIKLYSSSSTMKKKKSSTEHDKDEKLSEDKRDNFCNFTELPEFFKLYDSLNGSYNNYKSSLDLQGDQKMTLFIDSILDALQILLSTLTLTEIGPITQELLMYLNNIVYVCPSSAIDSVYELLQSLSGARTLKSIPGDPFEKTDLLYYICFANQYSSLHQHLISEHEKKNPRPKLDLLKIPNPDSSIVLASYIRMFENVVVEGLRLYTSTSNNVLQCHVLKLIAHLIHLKVNYALLDSEQTFLKFVLRQLEAMELQQFNHSKDLVEWIFQLLILLSYDHLYSKGKNLISIPKILQHCDAFMASGAPPTMLCIPALKPVVDDVFLVRGALITDPIALQELETQKEVLLSMLLRLAYYPDVYDMLSIILHASKEKGQAKWNQVSRHIADTLLPLLMTQNIYIGENGIETLNCTKSVLRLLSPAVFRPVEQLLKAFLVLPQNPTPVNTAKWLCCLVACMEILLKISTEDHVLIQMASLGIDPDSNIEREPHEVLAAAILKNLHLSAQELHSGLKSNCGSKEIYEFLCQLLAQFLLYFAYMCQSGLFCHVAVSAKELIVSDSKTTETLHSIFLDLAPVRPSLCLLWSYLLLQLDYNDLGFWRKILFSSDIFDEGKCVNDNGSLELVRKGGVILLCDYLCDNLQDAETLSLLFVNHIEYVIDLYPEPPVKELIDAVHRNPAACGLLIQAIHTHFDFASNPSMSLKVFRCIRNSHSSQWGKVVVLLIEKALNTPIVAITRRANNMCCHYIEWLLQQQPQFSEDVMERLQSLAPQIKPYPQYRRILGLLEKLGLKVPSPKVLPCLARIPDEIVYNNYANIIRQWLYSREFQPAVIIELLKPLEYSDCLSLLLERNISLKLLTPAMKSKGDDSINLRNAAQVATVSHVHHSITAYPLTLLPRLLERKDFWDTLLSTASATACLVGLTERFSKNDKSDLVSFIMLCLESVKLQNSIALTPNVVNTLLEAVNAVLKLNSISSEIGSNDNTLSNMLSCLYEIVECYSDFQLHEGQLSDVPIDDIKLFYAHSLLSWTQSQPKLPSYLFNILNEIIVGMCRFNNVYPIAVLPTFSFSKESIPDMNSGLESQLPISSFSLQETEILLNYVYRVMSLGWTKRLEFEECWMNLLGLLNLGNETCANPDVEAVLIKSTCVAVQAITGLLIFSTLSPNPGNPHNSALLHVTRNSPKTVVSTLSQPNLLDDFIQISNYFPPMSCNSSQNLERLGANHVFGPHQISLSCINEFLFQQNDKNYLKIRADKLLTEGIDTLSCMRFLLDLYSTWMLNELTPISVLTLAVQSTVILSDIFTEKSQYKWMLDIFIDVHKSGSRIECDNLLGILTLGICKAAALLEIKDNFDKVKSIYEEALNSSWLSTRCFALYGCLYLLEGGSESQLSAVMPTTLEYLMKQLPITSLTEPVTESHSQLLWSVSMYCSLYYPQWQLASIRTFHEEITNRLDLLTPSMLTRFESISIWYLHGSVPISSIPGMRKLCIKLINNANYLLIYYGLKILISDLYTGYDDKLSEVSADKHLMALERFMLLLERMQRGCNFEAPILVYVMKQILKDLVPASDVVHKLLCELTIPMKAHAPWIGSLLFNVLGSLPKEELTEWIIPSIASYVKITPIPVGVWRLTCLLLSAIKSPWMRKLYILLHMHINILRDKEWLLSVAALHFFRELESEDSKVAFLSCLGSSSHITYRHLSGYLSYLDENQS